jgi:hypothetical protein
VRRIVRALRGAVHSMILSVESKPAPAELERLERWWKRPRRSCDRQGQFARLEDQLRLLRLRQAMQQKQLNELLTLARAAEITLQDVHARLAELEGQRHDHC